MDDRKQRLVIDRTMADGERYFGWEVADAAALQALAARLEQAGVAVRRETAALADQRFVRELISFADPAGNRLEAFHGADIASDAVQSWALDLRVPHRAAGHGPRGVPREEHRRFVRLLSRPARLRRQRLHHDAVPGVFHARQPAPSQRRVDRNRPQDLHHLMVELYSLDDVGQGYDIALGEPEKIMTTLGRHPNDTVMSYYLKSPSGFMLEYGWGGKDRDARRLDADRSHRRSEPVGP